MRATDTWFKANEGKPPLGAIWRSVTESSE